jgi:hypothetical protein
MHLGRIRLWRSSCGRCPEAIPDVFHLYMTLDFASRRRCRVVWRSKTQIGVKFLS